MLDMNLVENTIQELENSDTTFVTCEKLASLYIVRHFNTDNSNAVIKAVSDDVEKELSDILPHYKKYCEMKREYQLNGTNKDAMLMQLMQVCREILEFVHTLYSTTDLPDQRAIIVGTLSNIQF